MTINTRKSLSTQDLINGALFTDDLKAGVYVEAQNLYVHHFCGVSPVLEVIDLTNAMKRGKPVLRVRVMADEPADLIDWLIQHMTDDFASIFDAVRDHYVRGEETFLFQRSRFNLGMVTLKGSQVYSPFVSVKPLIVKPKRWNLGHVSRLLLTEQAELEIRSKYSDDYAHDAETNYGQRKMDKGEAKAFAAKLLADPDGWRVYPDENRVGVLHLCCHHFDYREIHHSLDS